MRLVLYCILKVYSLAQEEETPFCSASPSWQDVSAKASCKYIYQQQLGTERWCPHFLVDFVKLVTLDQTKWSLGE